MDPDFPRVYRTMDSPLIQLRLKGRLVQTYSFQGDLLRIGRMRENDIVISNASVSRFHAVLKLEKGKVILEDSGSENGCYVNGTRIVNSIVLVPGDEIMIGKHQLVLMEGGAEKDAPAGLVKGEKNDLWDASKTYFVDVESQAKMLGGAGSEPAAASEFDVEAEPPPADASELAAPEVPAEEVDPVVGEAEVESASAPLEDAGPEPIEDTDEEWEAWTSASDDADEEEGSEEITSPPEPAEDAPFEFGMEADPASASAEAEPAVDPEDYDVELVDDEEKEDAEQMVESVEPMSHEVPSPAEPTWYAGLIIQHRGKLDRILSWDQEQLVAGRSRECEIFLDQAEISRRHAVFVREEGRYEVRDLDSINGIVVNGEKTRSHVLALGDVVKIEDFDLTFLLDRQPIASEIKTQALPTPVAAGTENRFNMTMIDEALPIRSSLGDPIRAEEPAALEEEKLVEIPEGSLFERDDAEEQGLVEVEAISPAPSEDQDSGIPVVTDEVLTLELRVRVEDLPPALRAALADLDPGELRLPVEIVLRADE